MPRESFRSLDPSVQHVVDLMGRFGPVHARAMFGGHGLYRDGVMFALMAGRGLFLKVDEQSLADFAERNLRAFSFTAKGRTVQLSYREAPPEALEDGAVMADWCQRAWQAALRAQKTEQGKGATRGKGGKGGKRGKATAQRQAEQLLALPNLGPRSVDCLLAAGVPNLASLRQLGAVRAFARARAINPAVSLNLLWALEGALTGRRWQDVAETDRASLLMALEDAQREP